MSKLPFTKDGYRYFLCEDDEPLCTEYIKEINNIGEPNKRNNTVWFKRMVISNDAKLSYSDKAPQLKLEPDELTVTGEKGYSMIRGTHGINRGTYYFEVKIQSMPQDSAARIGWGQCFANLQAPLGYDYFGYSWRSVFGTKFHQARGKTYDSGDEHGNNRGYKAGDTIGCMIELPFHNEHNLIEPHQLPTSIKGHALLLVAKKKERQRTAEVEDKPPPLSSLRKHIGSRISFFKNGIPIGVAFEDMLEGNYYPSISLYRNCTVTANFGPTFTHPPTLIKTEFHSGDKHHYGWPHYSPVQDIPSSTTIDHLLSDMVFIVDGEVKCPALASKNEAGEFEHTNIFRDEIEQLKKTD